MRRTVGITSGRIRKGPAARRAAAARRAKGELDPIVVHWPNSAVESNDASAKVSSVTSEAVNHPAHYNVGQIEVIDAIEDWKLCFHLGNAVKYIARADHKGSYQKDLEKAIWYLNRAIYGKD